MMKNGMEMPTHKVGIKLLTEQQMLNVIPSYRSLLERIENHRRQIGKMEGMKLRHYQYNMMYDNVFSIFGNRGTGKTSVAFTLQERFRENEDITHDVVLPIIIPEVIPSDCSALGWLLEIVGEKILQLFDDSIEQNVGQDGYDFWRKCKYSEQNQEYGDLKKKFEELEQLYYSVKYNPSVESSYTLAVGNSARQAQNYYKLSQKITEFWDCLIETIIKKHSSKHHKDSKNCVTPLVYFIFDDVDLAPEKVNELMSIIIKYLSHPNIIVIATADEEVVLEVIENNLDTNIGRIPKEWRYYLNKSQDERGKETRRVENDSERSDLIRKMARRYLGKVMPTSTRYYLRLFETAEEKWGFRIDERWQLGDAVIQLVDQMLEKLGGEGKNFLKVGDTELHFYLNFFGNTSRQIGNAFLGVQEFLEESAKIFEKGGEIGEREEEMYELCRHFFQIAITANHNLAEILEDVEGFVHEIFWLEHNNWKLFIDYTYLQSFLRDLLKREKKEQVVRITIQLYSLLLFAENVLVIIDSQASNGITGRMRVHGLVGMTQFICEQVFKGKQKFRMDWEAEEFLLHYGATLNRICYLPKSEGDSEKSEIEYFYDFLDYPYEEKDVGESMLLLAFKKSKDWLREIARSLSNVYGNVYLVGKKEVGNCLFYKKRYSLCKYQRVIESLLLQDIRTSLQVFDVRETAQTELEILSKISSKRFSSENYENYSEDVRNKIRNTILDNLKEEYLEECLKDNTTNIDHNGNDDAFWTDYTLKLEEKYKNSSAVSLSEIINYIDKDCEKDNLERILQKLPVSTAKMIAERLERTSDRESLLLTLCLLQNFLVKWDQGRHFIEFENMTEFFRHADEIRIQREDFVEIVNVSRNIQKFLSDLKIDAERFKEESSWSLLDKTFYTELKASLQNICVILDAEKGVVGSNRAGLSMRVEKLAKSFDISIDLEDKKEFKEAVLIGVSVQVMKQIQRLYLYQTVVQKYELGYGHSSVRLEKVKSKRLNDKNSYYYAIFLTMKQLLKKEKLDSIEEMDALKNLIDIAYSEDRNQYLTKLINEVQNESNSN